MTIEVGVAPCSGESPSDWAHPSRIGGWRRAADLRPGWRVRLADGRWAVVLEEPALVALGRVAAEVGWSGYCEGASWPAMRLVWSRTPVEQAAYLDAVEVDAAVAAISREGNGS